LTRFCGPPNLLGMKDKAAPPEKAAGPKLRRVAENLYQYCGSQVRYYARFRHKGERIIQPLGTRHAPCTSLPEARRLLRECRNKLDRLERAARRKNFGQLLEEFQKVLAGSEATLKYKKRYLGRLKTDFPVPLKTKVGEIKKSHVVQFLAPFKSSTADHYNHVLTLVREVFQYAVDDQMITVSPAEGIKYRKRQATVKRLIPSWAEFERIVESIRSQVLADTAHDSANLVEFMGKAGLGQAECAGLRWQDINFESDEILIIRQKTRAEFSIQITPLLRPLLERLNKARGDDRRPTDKVFTVRDPKKALQSACERLGLPAYSPRAFRRMFISRCLHDLGIDVQTIASWQGHKDGGQLILRTYARASREHQKEMAKRVVAPETPQQEGEATPNGSDPNAVDSTALEATA
jgi:integrase